MSQSDTFTGFPEEALRFYNDLIENNETIWFKSHKSDYEDYIMQPARLFVTALGEKLKAIATGVHAEPKVNKTLFRINRDIRFSADKRPYKTHLGMWFWDGEGKRMESSGFYVHVDTDKIMLGVGLHSFPKPVLGKYREHVVDPKRGPALEKAIRDVAGDNEFSIGGAHYKRVPRGFDADHKYADLLRHNGLFASIESAIPDEFFTAEFPEYCFSRFEKMLPIHKWILPLTE